MNLGYSLLELIVTITVATILTAIAIPYFTQSSTDAGWFNEQAKAAVRYAQRQAVAQRRPVYVNVTASTITLCYNAPPGCASPVPDLATGIAYSLAVPASVNVTAASFSFNGLGQPDPIAGASFTAGSGSVTIAAETGFVR